MTLTPAVLRTDSPGRACGQSFIAAGKTCHVKSGGLAQRSTAAEASVSEAPQTRRTSIRRNIAIGATALAAAGVIAAGGYGYHLGRTPDGRRRAAGLAQDLTRNGVEGLASLVSNPAPAFALGPLNAGSVVAGQAVRVGSRVRRAQEVRANAGSFARSASALATRKETVAGAREHYLAKMQQAWADHPPRSAAEATRRTAETRKVEADLSLLRRQSATRSSAARRASAWATPGAAGQRRVKLYGTDRRRRTDAAGRACGQSFITAGKTCHQKGAFPTGKAIAAGLTAGAVGAALLHKGSRKAILGAPGAARRTAQRAATEVVHRATAKPPSMRLTPEAFEQIKPTSKTQRLHRAAQQANVNAERAMRKAAQAEIERAQAVGTAMYAAGKATRASLRSGLRRHNLTVAKLRRRYEPGFGRRDSVSLQLNGTRYIDPAHQRRDTEDGKKYSKTVTNPKTGRKNKVRYGAKGYTIAPGTDKGDKYCARSFGDMKSHGKDCSGADRNTPLCLSRAKWKCSGKTSRRS